MKKLALALAITSSAWVATAANAATYQIDVKGMHAFVQFKIQHLGYSWLLGRFNDFSGEFEYDAKSPNDASINVEIDTASLDSNHAERDKHLKGADFLDVKKYPKATFKSTKYESKDDMSGVLTGDLTLHGVTKQISFPVNKIGEGKDPWGGYRAGFEGETTLKLKDYGINYNLGPASQEVQLELYIEGIRK